MSPHNNITLQTIFCKEVNNSARTIVGIIGLFTFMVAALGSTPAYALSHYQIGYNDGCAGRTVPGSHTADYERGYTHGQEACHNSGASQGPTTVATGKQEAKTQSSTYQIGYNDAFYNTYGSPKPGHHTAGYMNGFNAGLAARNSGQSSLKSSSPFPCAGGTGVEYCSGYHDGAVQADRDDAEMSKGTGSVDVNKHLPCVNSNPDYCRGFIKGYNDEADVLA